MIPKVTFLEKSDKTTLRKHYHKSMNKELVEKYDVCGFVLGLPKNMNNTLGPRAEASRAYGELLIETFGLPIDFQDERLTTVEAERMLVEQADASRKKRKKVIDKLAASLILQNYLDASGKLLAEIKK